MNDGKRWITWKGRRILVNDKGNIVKDNKQDEKEKYFNEHFYLEDGDYLKEFDWQNKDSKNGKKYWNEKEKAYDYGHGTYDKRISAIDKETKQEVGHIKYKEVYDPSKLFIEDKFHVDSIYVDEKYRRQGIATQLYKELQRRAGNQDIYFGEMTPEGKKLINKIGKITKQTRLGSGKYVHYWGRINK